LSKLKYEKPGLICLSHKTVGQVSIQGTCKAGTWPGPAPAPGSMICTNGSNADWPGVPSWCSSGSGGPATLTCATGTGVSTFNPL
jgi:hypothetical protein